MSNPYIPDKPRNERVIEEIQQLSKELGKVPTRKEFNGHGEFSDNQAKSEFGSWSNAISESGVKNEYPASGVASPQELIEEIHRLKKKLGRTPTTSDLSEHGKFKSSSPYERVFGSWKEAVQEAGFDTNSGGKISKEELKKELNRVAIELEKVPQTRDIKEHCKYSIGPYNREFGSLKNALQQSKTYQRLDLLNEVRDVSIEIDAIPTISEAESLGRFDKDEYLMYFDSWHSVIESSKIDYSSNEVPYRGELLDELRQLHEELNRSPDGSDIRKFSEYGLISYIRVFGSFENAVQSYVK